MFSSKVAALCAECGAPFTMFPCEAKRGRRFCSLQCVGKSHAKHRTGSNSQSYKGGVYDPRPCEECSKLYRPTSNPKKSKHHFCSKSCKGKWFSRNHRGEKHHMWRGGHVHYYGPNWSEQKRAARKRDGHKCQVCGATKGQRVTKTGKKVRALLDVHHIRPFREFGYIIGENDNYLQANDLTNLITLCPLCHKKAEFGSIPLQGYLL